MVEPRFGRRGKAEPEASEVRRSRLEGERRPPLHARCASVSHPDHPPIPAQRSIEEDRSRPRSSRPNGWLARRASATA